MIAHTLTPSAVKTTDQGTAARETALCEWHDTPDNRSKVESWAGDDVVGPWVTGAGENEELVCVLDDNE
jgi:hypothetical protein